VGFAATTLCVASQRVFIDVLFLYRHSPETFGYTLVCRSNDKLRTSIVKGRFAKPQETYIRDAVMCNLLKCCRELENLSIEETYK
jgi:hypothetical protein